MVKIPIFQFENIPSDFALIDKIDESRIYRVAITNSLHFRIHCTMNWKVKVLVAQPYLTLCDPMDCSLPGSSVCGILQARVPEWVAVPFPGNLPNLGTESGSPSLQADSSLSSHQESPIL